MEGNNGTVLVTGPAAASAAPSRCAWPATATTSWCTAAAGAPRREAVRRGDRKRMGRAARVLRFDVADRAAVRAALEADIDAHGAYYGVVCNAGIARDNAFPAMTGEDWDSVLHTNLDGFYNVLHPLVMPMVRRRKPGRIVTLVVGLGPDRQPRPDQLQRRQGRHHRRHQGAGAGAGQARHHRQLRGARPDRHRDGQRGAAGEDDEDDPDAPHRHARGSGRRGGVPDVGPDAAYITRQVISVNGGLA